MQALCRRLLAGGDGLVVWVEVCHMATVRSVDLLAVVDALALLVAMAVLGLLVVILPRKSLKARRHVNANGEAREHATL